MSNLALRVLTALVGIPVLLGAAYVGGWPFAVLVLAIALVGQYELYRMMERGGTRPLIIAGLGLGALVGLGPLFPSALLLAVLGVVLLLAALPFRLWKDALSRIGTTLLGVIYPTALLMLLVDLRLSEPVGGDDVHAFYLVLTLFLLVWATDTMAYFTGRAIGRHPLAPSISPNKTREGAVGGVVGALLVGVMLGFTLLDFVPWIHLIVLILLVAVISQLGDLTESAIKRSAGVKDSGAILPGHGGVLDRFDALILAAPMFFIYLRYVARLIA